MELRLHWGHVKEAMGDETRPHSGWKRWKPKSKPYAPFYKIHLFAKPLNKQSWKFVTMKIWHHFYSKKACSYTRICKRNFFLMHGIQEMNFFSFCTLLGSNVFWKKVKVNNKILQNWVCLMFLLGLRKFFSILRFIHFINM